MSLTKRMTARFLAGATALVLLLGLVLGTGFAVDAAALEAQSETQSEQEAPVHEPEETPQDGQDAAQQDDEPSDEPSQEAQTPEQDLPSGEPDEEQPTQAVPGQDEQLPGGAEATSLLLDNLLLDLSLPGESAENPAQTGDELMDIWNAVYASGEAATIYLAAGTIKLPAPLSIDPLVAAEPVNVTFVAVDGETTLMAPDYTTYSTSVHHFLSEASSSRYTPTEIHLGFSGVTLDGNTTLQNGGTGRAGGVNATFARVSLDGAKFVNCARAVNAYHGYHADDPGHYLRLTNCSFVNGETAVSGYGNLQIENCRFEGNSGSAYLPAAVRYQASSQYNSGAPTVVIRGTDFVNNTNSGYTSAAAMDGVVQLNGYALGTSVVIENCNFTDNTAGRGAAVYTWAVHNVTVKNSGFTGNTATGYQGADGEGGAIVADGYNYGGKLVLEGNTFTENWAEYGGALYTQRFASVEVTGGSFIRNTAYEMGGAGHVRSNNGAVFSGVSFQDNDAYSGGALVGLGGRFTLVGVSLTGNEAENHGGAVYLDGTALTMTGGSMSGNTAAKSGGALYAFYYSKLNLDGVVFENNTATAGYGGAVYVAEYEGETVELTLTGASRFANNRALAGGGGAVYARNAALTTTGTAFIGNSAQTEGGALRVDKGGDIQITDGEFTENLAGNGAGLYIGNIDQIQVKNTTFEGNKASYSQYGGGALTIFRAPLAVLEELTVTGNEGDFGGAVRTEYIDELRILNSEFTANIAYTRGGVLHSQGEAVIYIEGCDFERNEARGTFGGALFMWGIMGTIPSYNWEIVDSAFEGNTAADGGGAVFASKADSLTITDTDFEGNTSGNAGGALYSNSVPLVVTDTTFQDNESGNNGGAVFISGTATLALGGETRLAGNRAPVGDGGAIYVDYAALGNITAGPNVAFSTNQASKGYQMHPDDAALHAGNISATQFSALGYAYNNHDIAYTAGDEIDGFEVIYNPGRGEGAIVTLPLTPAEAQNYLLLAHNDVALQYSRVGHIFLGWSTDPDATTADSAYTPGDHINVVGSLTLYAVWQAREYTVTFVVPGGATSTDRVTYGALVPEPAAPSRTGHTFRGWFLDGGTRWVFVNDTVNNLPAMTMPAGDMTLTARLEINSYVLTFRYNNGTTNDLVLQVEYGAEYERPAEPTRAGYSFAGWYDQSGNLWAAQSGTMPAANVTYDARWNEVEQPSSSSEPQEESSSTPTPDPGPGPAPSSSSSSSSRVVSTTTSRVVSSGASSTAPGQASSAAPAASAPASSAPVSSAPTAPAESQPDADEQQERDEPVVNLFGIEVPLGGLGASDGWSAANLLLALVALVNTAFAVIRLVRRRKRVDDAQFLTGSAPNKGRLFGLAGLVAGVLPAVLLPILENVGLGMMMFSRWTPLFLALTIAHFGCTILGNIAAKRSI